MQPPLIACTPAVEDAEADAAAKAAEEQQDAAEDERQEKCFNEALDQAPESRQPKRTSSARHVGAVLQNSSGKQK